MTEYLCDYQLQRKRQNKETVLGKEKKKIKNIAKK
jgi:hypothetical protein